MARSTTKRLGPALALLGSLALACGVIVSRGACTDLVPIAFEAD